jgi:nitroimidazol reductase NimA-like FMN-containing flavoprotein (pyridoxamine 5'-phosphate oxidase superfamily)
VPENTVTDRQVMYDVLDAGLVAHVGVVDAHQPFVLPCAYARDRDTLLLHGSTGSRLLRSVAAGMPTCVTVTLLDGIVYARSVFHSSMNYRSVMVLGRGCTVADDDKERALHRIAEHIMPGRWPDARPPSRKELAATLVVSLPLDEVSVKVGAGLPAVEPEDADWHAWSGLLPLTEQAGPARSVDDDAVPDYVRGWQR